MNLQPYYEDSYQSENNRSPRDISAEVTQTSKGLFNYVVESKNRFLESVDWSELKILELGSGRGGLSLHLARLGAQVTLLDFSESAMLQAEKVFALENLPVRTLVADVTHPDVSLGGEFDIIVDSHLLHCLTEDPDRSSYYRLIYDHLSPRGICVAESMVYRKKLFVPDGFMFDERKVLWQMFGKWTPVRRILDSLDLEEELRAAGFDIIYFFYYAQFSFVPHQSFMEIPAEVLPASVRMVFQKK